ncbi:MAG: DUF4199 domain-containing protein [Gemmatimonadaceae bacterium]|nr:DUF4199 domain-containing protein [Gemmatimonadaceae bacterium]
MKKTVLTFGLLSGFVLSVMMLLTMPFHDRIGFDRAMIVGYTTMILAALFVYFGVRSYRDNVNNGTVSFGRAFIVGMLISFVAIAMYVTTWELSKNRIAPDYMEKYQAHVIEKGKASGRAQAEIDAEVAEVRKWAEMAKNPLMSAAFTSLEPLPVALLASLFSAFMLKRKRREDEMA